MSKTPYDLAVALADIDRELARLRQRLYAYLFGTCDLRAEFAERICEAHYEAVTEGMGFTATQSHRINVRLKQLADLVEKHHHLARNGLPER